MTLPIATDSINFGVDLSTRLVRTISLITASPRLLVDPVAPPGTPMLKLSGSRVNLLFAIVLNLDNFANNLVTAPFIG